MTNYKSKKGAHRMRRKHRSRGRRASEKCPVNLNPAIYRYYPNREIRILGMGVSVLSVREKIREICVDFFP